jgi:hypothetical protein
VFSDKTRNFLRPYLADQRKQLKYLLKGQACSRAYLQEIDVGNHQGLPLHFHGADLNADSVALNRTPYLQLKSQEIQRRNDAVDDLLVPYLGAHACALKAFYPRNGFIGWHTNWDNPGYNVVFSYSETGKGYWRHVDSSRSRSQKPDANRLIQIDDRPGWNCKVGYFGGPEETDRIVWHCAYSSEPRLTLSYMIPDLALWRNLVEELTDEA